MQTKSYQPMKLSPPKITLICAALLPQIAFGLLLVFIELENTRQYNELGIHFVLPIFIGGVIFESILLWYLIYRFRGNGYHRSTLILLGLFVVLSTLYLAGVALFLDFKFGF